MAKVMVSFPDELLAQIDSEADRQGTTRSGLLQKAVRREIGLGVADREDIMRRLDAIAEHWNGPTDVVAFIRRDRMRDG